MSHKHKAIFQFFIIVLSAFISVNVFAQKTDFSSYESELKAFANQLVYGENDNEKLDAHNSFLETWDLILDDPKSMKYSFDSLTTLFPILTSDDKKMRIINWHIPLDNNINQYHAIVQYFDNKKKYQVKYLEPMLGEVKSANSLKLINNQWIGALYYHLSSFKRGNKTYYLLLGWDGNDERSNKKIIDVLSISSKSLVFGAPIFRYKKQRLHRFILEYKEDAAVSMKYFDKSKQITFPNLIPINDDLEGLYDFYVPDGSINAFELVNGSFKFKEDIENPQKVNVPKIKKIDSGLFPK
ncbi:MAG: hypothetical protein ISR00_03820 [Flavobacteriales bacterium]|nr:hypothetical protein [Flavobacteriales bacterium]